MNRPTAAGDQCPQVGHQAWQRPVTHPLTYRIFATVGLAMSGWESTQKQLTND